jgi:hypothetical protein
VDQLHCQYRNRRRGRDRRRSASHRGTVAFGVAGRGSDGLRPRRDSGVTARFSVTPLTPAGTSRQNHRIVRGQRLRFGEPQRAAVPTTLGNVPDGARHRHSVVAVLLVLAVIVIAGYNGLVRARNAYKNAFAQIDVQLLRRFDLIPNLIETAKGVTWRTSGPDPGGRRGGARRRGSSLSGPRLADYFVLCSRVVVVRCVGCRPRTGAS